MENFLKEINAKIEGKVEKQGRKYYLINKEVESIKKETNRRPEYLGVFLGEKKKSFHPSPALIELLSKNSNSKSVVNEKAEWMFLCGKDVFAENTSGKQSGIVFVQNEYDENLGYGKWMKKKGRLIIKNMLDKGVYLRKGY